MATPARPKMDHITIHLIRLVATGKVDLLWDEDLVAEFGELVLVELETF